MMRVALRILFILALAWRLDAQPVSSPEVEAWRASGQFLTWTSTLPENAGHTTQVFHTCLGDATKPTIVMVHGFPTSSYDFRLLAGELRADFRVCTLDFPGYGLSDKPPSGYRYTLADDAALLWRFVTDTVPLKEFILLSHDRGDSVALNFLQLYQAASNPPFRITHQFILNGNLYLPLANLTDFQKRMLDPATAPLAVRGMSPGLLGVGLGQTQYTPPLRAGDAEVKALSALFAVNAGIAAIPATIQYLNERKQMEVQFLDTLGKSAIPATIMWGAHDMVSPTRVADYAFTTALKPRRVYGASWLMPCANHYVQHDQPAEVAKVIRFTLSQMASGKPPQPAPFNLGTDSCSAVLTGREG